MHGKTAAERCYKFDKNIDSNLRGKVAPHLFHRRKRKPGSEPGEVDSPVKQ